MALHKYFDLLPTKPGILDKTLDGEVRLNPDTLKNISPDSGLVKEAIELIQHHKDVEKLVWWARAVSNDSPFRKGIKDIIHKSINEATEHKIITGTEVHKGILTNSTHYSIDENARNKVISLIRSFALEGHAPKSIKEIAIVALFWAFEHLGDQLSNPVVSQDILQKDNRKEARSNMREFFLKTYGIKLWY